LLSSTDAWSTPAEVLLHFAARAEHAERTIRPALATGRWVISDRFHDSTMAYQGYGQGADRALIAALTALIGLQPDLTIVLDIDPATARLRLASRSTAADRYERMGPAFHAAVAVGFREIAAREPDRCVLIDADSSVDALADRVAAVVARRFGLPLPNERTVPL
jgi:dTMP kinase